MLKVSGKCDEKNKNDIIEQIIGIFDTKENIYGEAYIGYPLYSIEYTNEQLICDLAIVSNYGLFVINIIDKELLNYGELQDELYIKIESKLKKCSFLVDKRKLPFEINVLSYTLVNIEPIDGYPICKNIKQITDYIISNEKNIDNNKVDLISSGIQEAQGLNKKTEHHNAV